MVFNLLVLCALLSRLVPVAKCSNSLWLSESSQSLWTTWQTWRHCSATCGPGTTLRHRICRLGLEGKACQGLEEESQPCNLGDCPGTRFPVLKRQHCYSFVYLISQLFVAAVVSMDHHLPSSLWHRLRQRDLRASQDLPGAAERREGLLRPGQGDSALRWAAVSR